MQSACDYFQHAIHVVHDVVIPESQYSVVVFAQPLVTLPVLIVFVVLPTVDLNDQTPFAAHEVDNIATNGRLPYELMAIDGP